MVDIPRCYEVLGVAPDASLEEINRAYRELVLVWHPDRFAHNAHLQEKATEKMKEINAAFESLQRRRSQMPPDPPLRTSPGPTPAWTPPDMSSEPFDFYGALLRRAKFLIIPTLVVAASGAFLLPLYLRAMQRWNAFMAPVREIAGVGAPALPAGGSLPQSLGSLPTGGSIAGLTPGADSEDIAMASSLAKLMGSPGLPPDLSKVLLNGGGLSTQGHVAQLDEGFLRLKGKRVEGKAAASEALQDFAAQQAAPRAPKPLSPFSLLPGWQDERRDQAPAPGYFSVGSPKSVVLAVEGEPDAATETSFRYGDATVYFQNGFVTDWEFGRRRLRARWVLTVPLKSDP